MSYDIGDTDLEVTFIPAEEFAATWQEYPHQNIDEAVIWDWM